MLEAARADHNPYLAPAFVVAVETAMRRGELLSFEWKQVSLERRVIQLKPEQTKTSKGRVVPLSRLAINTLEGLPRNAAGVFPISRYQIERGWKRIAPDDLNWHDLRHEAVSRFFEKGLSAEQVMSISGHSSYAMLARYTHLRANDIADLL